MTQQGDLIVPNSEINRPDPRLVELLLALRERIQRHYGYLSAGGGETRTRELLINPMLRVLGWNLEYPDQVQLEYPVGDNKRTDYALMHFSGHPIAIVEAKELGSQFDKSTIRSRWERSGVPWCILTDGDNWKCYGEDDGPNVESRFVLAKRDPQWEFDISDFDETSIREATALTDLLRLSRTRAIFDYGKSRGIPLTSVNPNSKSDTKPDAVWFPKAGSVALKKLTIDKYRGFAAVLRTMAEWIRGEKLVDDDRLCSIKAGEGSNKSIVSIESGEIKCLSGNPAGVVVYATRLAKACYVDPSKILVHFSD